MLKTRAQGEETMFKWARTEIMRELVMSQSTYAKLAGIQSEIGRVVITRIAGSEVEYKRLLNTYRKDATCSMNSIRREQVKMKMKLRCYAQKLRQTRVEHAKIIRDQQKRDKERSLLEHLHLRLKFEAAAKTPEPTENPDGSLDTNAHLPEQNLVSSLDIDHYSGSLFLQKGHVSKSDGNLQEACNEIQTAKHTKKQGRVFSPFLPMIKEEVEKEAEVFNEDGKFNDNNSEQMVPDQFALKIWDEDVSVSSYGGRIKKKKYVSFSDILKLKYSRTKYLFDLVHRLARKHGILDEVEKVPDPRDRVVLRGFSNDSYKLQAAVLYPMKYGYSDKKQEMVQMMHDSKSPSSIKSPLIVSHERDITAKDYHKNDEKPKRVRNLSLENKRAIFLPGTRSKSLDDNVEHISLPDLPNSNRKLKSEELSLAELSEKVSRLKLRKSERLATHLDNNMRSNSRLLLPTMPSSFRSSKSLPVLLKNDSSRNNISWTHAFGLLKGVHSLDDVYTP